MLETCDLWPFSSNYEWRYDSNVNSIMNDITGIMNYKKGHNVMNDIEQLCISQTAYFVVPSLQGGNGPFL